MNRLNRRRFMALSSAGVASAVLVACGNEPPTDEEMNPTQIPDVAGAPPTLAPITGTPVSETAEENGDGEEPAGGEAGVVEIEAFDMGYDPTDLELAPGDTLVMNNTGVLEHDLVIEDFDDEEVIPLIGGGESAEWTVPDDVEIGSTVTFYCSVPGHRESGMEGTITFVEASAAAPEEEGEEEAAAGRAGGDVEIEAGDMYYEPSEIEMAPGDVLTMNNAGVLEHDLIIEDWDDEEAIPLISGGDSAEFTIPEDAEVGSTVTFYCSVPGHRESGMEGTLTIVEAGAAEEAPDDEATPEEEDEAAAAGATDQESEGDGEAATVEVEAGDMYYEPSELEMAPGDVLVMNNAGVLEHDLIVEDWDDEEAIPLISGGDSAEFTIPDDAEVGSTVTFYCSVPGHRESGMEGTLTIVEGGGAAAAEDDATPEDEEAAAAGATDEEAADGEGATEVAISAFDFGYDPAEATVAPGATIIMTNDGFVEHDLAVDAWGGEIVALIGSGEQAEGTIPEDAQPGETFEFYCTVAGHYESGMVGTFTVAAAGGDAEAGDGEGEDDASEASPEPEISGNAIEIAANEWTYSPSEVEVAPGDTIILRNDGAMAHDMSSAEWGEPFIPEVAHGETGTFVVPEDAEIGSTIEIYSVNQGARNLGMTGTITIVEESIAITAPSAPAATPVVSPEEAATPDAATPEASGDGETIEVEAGDIYFEPNEFEASPGDTIVMTNAGVLEHDMASEALGVTMIEMLSAGETGEYVIPDDASGEIDIYCTVAGHKEAGMVGTITIV